MSREQQITDGVRNNLPERHKRAWKTPELVMLDVGKTAGGFSFDLPEDTFGTFCCTPPS